MWKTEKLKKVTKSSRKWRDVIECDEEYLEVIKSLKSVEKNSNRDKKKSKKYINSKKIKNKK
jgi:hypothetical protein